MPVETGAAAAQDFACHRMLRSLALWAAAGLQFVVQTFSQPSAIFEPPACPCRRRQEEVMPGKVAVKPQSSLHAVHML